jgi:hypothetical protein
MNAFNLRPPSFFGNAKPASEVLRVLTYPQQFEAWVVSIPTKSEALISGQICTIPLKETIGDLDLLPLELLNTF